MMVNEYLLIFQKTNAEFALIYVHTEQLALYSVNIMRDRYKYPLQAED